MSAEKEQFRLWREDDNGRQFPMNIVGPKELIEEKLLEYQGKGHKQFYFSEQSS